MKSAADEREPNRPSADALRWRPLVGCALLIIAVLLLVGYVLQNNITHSVPEVSPTPSLTSAV